jgi:hypothetical protein
MLTDLVVLLAYGAMWFLVGTVVGRITKKDTP